MQLGKLGCHFAIFSAICRSESGFLQNSGHTYFTGDSVSSVKMPYIWHQVFMVIFQGLLPDLEVFRGVINLGNAKEGKRLAGLKKQCGVLI